ncbi:hypothetical protein FHS30_000160 [Simiduia aestuariiviva]|uniref:Uncharacterized protein n=1 Tax=Simiduia aestuariiviva TaxID=1510459 RepID=A0A839UG17_9GAMM|nr:hypothetical protein [Simiduia aestuariiviva]
MQVTQDFLHVPSCLPVALQAAAPSQSPRQTDQLRIQVVSSDSLRFTMQIPKQI